MVLIVCSVFANSAYLFYYAREARPMGKTLTQEEIQSLLMHDKEVPKVQVMEVTEVPSHLLVEKSNMYNLEQSFNVEATITAQVITKEKPNDDLEHATLKPNAIVISHNLPNESHEIEVSHSTTSLPLSGNEEPLSIESTLVPSSIATSSPHGIEETDNNQNSTEAPEEDSVKNEEEEDEHEVDYLFLF